MSRRTSPIPPRTVIVPTGSFRSIRKSAVEMSAPQEVSADRKAERVGFNPTPSITSSEPDNIVAAAIKNAAEEMSPGIVMAPPVKRAGPSSATERSLFAITGTPKPLNKRSVWSREGDVSMTVVRP